MDPTKLPIAVHYEDSPDRIRQDLLGRLYWDVFGPLGEVSVRDGATLTPLSNHAIKSESIADPALSRLAVHINVCETKHAMDETEEDEYRYQAPEPLVIEKLDGSPISLNDFVTQVHRYLDANQDTIYKCEDENYYPHPGEVEDGTMFVGNEPDDFVSFDGGVTSSDFLRSGNIPADSRFFFDDVLFNEYGTDESYEVHEYQVYVNLFVEGNLGMSFEQFWAQRDRV